MERPNTVAGLLAKRAEIDGQIRDMRERLQGLVSDLAHVDATIRLFDPDRALQLRRPPRQHRADSAFRGEMRRYVLSVLRDAGQPMTSLEVTTQIAITKGYDASDREHMILMRKRVTSCLYKLKLKGVIREIESKGEYKWWALAG